MTLSIYDHDIDIGNCLLIEFLKIKHWYINDCFDETHCFYIFIL
jgi:hypothetical protein